MVASSPSAVDVSSVPASGAPLLFSVPVGDPVVATQGATTWEVALIVLSVVVATALVATRLVEALSDRGVGLPSQSLTSGSGSGSEHTFDADVPGPEVTAHSYERLIAPETPLELLSDEGRIIRILVENGGRAYQYRIVEETEWSKSKVSRLLSEMHERGQVDKVSVGRENVIVLADRVPTDDPDPDPDPDPGVDPDGSLR